MMEQDPELVEVFFLKLLKWWPKTNPAKEVFFLSELEEIFDKMNETNNKHYLATHKLRLVKRIVESLKSLHFNVTERALLFFDNTKFDDLIFNEYDEEVWKRIISAL